jgi:hypothetical protein
MLLFLILGLILGFISYYHYIYNSYKYHGPKSSYMKKLRFKKNQKCYKLNTDIKICPI